MGCKDTVKRWMCFIANSLSMLAFGTILYSMVWLVRKDRYVLFLHPRLLPFLLAGIGIIICFILALMINQRRHPAVFFSRKAIRTIVILMPLIFMYTAAEQTMGVHALTKKITGEKQGTVFSQQNDTAFESGDSGTTCNLSLLDIARKMKDFTGKRVITEGLVYVDPNVPADHLMLFRFAIFCCAADATPVWVLVKTEGKASFENESWIQVDGTLEIVNRQGNDIPLIRAKKITRMKPPPAGAQYLFF